MRTTSEHHHDREHDRPDRARMLARLFGIAFLLVGIAGFIPGLTTNFDDMGFASDSSDAELFGLFQTSILHNLVHLAFGVAGLAMSRRWDSARKYLLSAGVIYVVLFVYGLFVGGRADEKWINFIPVNNEDDVLHLLLGLGLLASWFATRRRQEHDHVERRYESTTVTPVARDRSVVHDGTVADEPLARDTTGEPVVVEPVDGERRTRTR